MASPLSYSAPRARRESWPTRRGASRCEINLALAINQLAECKSPLAVKDSQHGALRARRVVARYLACSVTFSTIVFGSSRS